MTLTVAMYSHDSVGLGHSRRNRAIAHALAADLPRLTGQDVCGVLIAGHPDAPRDSLPAGWDWLVLPGFARTGSGYAPRRLQVGSKRLAGVRTAALSSVLDALAPDLFIADRHPFGVGGELRTPLARLRAWHPTRTVLGLREVLDTPGVMTAEWDRAGGQEQICEAYDAVWVYGDPDVYDPRTTGELPAGLAARARATGYLSHGRPADAGTAPAGPYLLTVLGGGSDGGPVARAAAAAEVPAGCEHLVVTGPQMPPAEVAAVRAAAGEQTLVLNSAANVPELIRGARAVVCMAGYNSLTEVLATDTPALVVPRTARRAEQPRRAAALAGLGLVDSLSQEACTPQTVGAWFRRAHSGPRIQRTGVDLEGLSRIGSLAAELLGYPSTTETMNHQQMQESCFVA